jgi:hypothetical protein
VSNPTIPAHPFVGPGQVAPQLPAPDACVECGRPEAIHPGSLAGYNGLIADEAERLAGALADIREAQDLGELTVREAADNRIQVLETHLARLRHLRAQFLGPE